MKNKIRVQANRVPPLDIQHRSNERIVENGKQKFLIGHLQETIQNLKKSIKCLDYIRKKKSITITIKEQACENEEVTCEMLTPIGIELVNCIATSHLAFYSTNHEINPTLFIFKECIDTTPNIKTITPTLGQEDHSVSEPVHEITRIERRNSKYYITTQDAEWLNHVISKYLNLCQQPSFKARILFFNNTFKNNSNSIRRYLHSILKTRTCGTITFIRFNISEITDQIPELNQHANIEEIKKRLETTPSKTRKRSFRDIIIEKFDAVLSEDPEILKNSDKIYKETTDHSHINSARKEIVKILTRSTTGTKVIGYCWRLTRGEGKSWTYHFLIVLNGDQNPAPLLFEIENKWREIIKEGFSHFEVFNYNSHHISLSGTRSLIQASALKYEIEDFIQYMTDFDYCLRLKLPRGVRAYGRGEIHRIANPT